jgi:hypothetical protein
VEKNLAIGRTPMQASKTGREREKIINFNVNHCDHKGKKIF